MARNSDPDRLPPNSYATRHRGPGRPVDRSQERYQPSPYAPQRTLPHGDVSLDGTRAWPQPSMTSRVLTYGGAALAAAAVTAGAVLAVRKVADLVTGNDDLDRKADRQAEKARARVYDADRGRAPGFAKLDEDERAAMRARARRRAEDDRATAARLRAEAARGNGERRPEDGFGGRPASVPRGAFGPTARGDRDGAPMRRRPPQKPASRNFLGDIEHTAESLTRNINGIVGAVGAAMAAFRSVSGQAEGILREFGNTADQVRSFLDRGQGGDQPAPAYRPQAAARAARDPYRKPARRDVVDLRDPETAGDHGALDPDAARTHRL